MGKLTVRQKFNRWLSTTRVYAWAMDEVLPYTRLTNYYTRMRGWKAKQGYALLLPGDIILTIDKSKVTSKIIGGEWSHATYCFNKDLLGVNYEIAEMTHSDFTLNSFFDAAYEADEFMIIRNTKATAEYIQNMHRQLARYKNAMYDDSFILDSRKAFGDEVEEVSLYCFELCYLLDYEGRMEASLDDLEHLGRKYISAEGLINAKNMEIIFDSRLAVEPARPF